MGVLIVVLVLALVLAGATFGYALNEREELATLRAQVAQPSLNGAAASDFERSIRSLIEAIPRPVFLTTADRMILDANRAALYLAGLPSERVIGRVLATVIQDYETTQMLIAAAATGAAQEHTISRTAERETWHVTVQPLSLPSATTAPVAPGGITHLLLFIDDETQLRYLETVRKDFVASVSHELRTPLASVKLLAETLQDTATGDPAVAREQAARITVEVDHLTELVDDLLELSRIESGRIQLELEPTDIAGVLEVTADRMRPLAEERHIALKVEAPPDLPAVQGDAERIGQVLINLIHNGIKFTPDGGAITLSAQLLQPGDGALPGRPFTVVAEPMLLVRVQDTGVGISEEDLPRVFERFFKARDLPRSTVGPNGRVAFAGHYGGTGLGLAIARHIVEAHHGHIWVESRLAQGSTFDFTLPLASRFA